MKRILLSLCAAIISAAATAQIEVPQPSPFSKIEQKVGLTDVSLEYSRPGMRGRDIFGDLVPYGEIWRTGANANTTITFSDPVTIGGKKLDEGTYAIYTIPKEGQWEVIFYKDSNNWGVPPEWDESKVALRTTAGTQKLPFEMETFTIMLDNLRNDAATLNFIWDDTVAALNFNVPTDEKALASIERVMNGPTAQDYYGAATYFHDAGKELEKAHQWITKAVEMGEPGAYWVLRRKSLIEADLGKKEQAIATAKKSLAAARKAGNKDYVKLNEESLKEWGGM